jgi:hypothetical protein
MTGCHSCSARAPRSKSPENPEEDSKLGDKKFQLFWRFVRLLKYNKKTHVCEDVGF